MIKLDKLAIVCPYNEETMNVKGFSTTITKTDEVINSLFPIDKKYKSEISLSYSRYAYNHRDGELRVEINSTLLGNKYPEKININNVENCLAAVLEKTHYNIFDPKELIQRGSSNHVHVTEDVNMTVDRDGYRAINSRLSEPNKWNQSDREQKSYGWASKLKGSQNRGMLRMYDKGHQMNGKKTKREFMQANEIATDTFDGVLRLELKLQSPEAIRRGFGIDDNKVLTILEARDNPIVGLIRNSFDLSEDQIQKDDITLKLGVREKLAFMNQFNNDWDTIERQIRISSGTNSSKSIKVYKSLYRAVVEDPKVRNTGVQLLKKMIEMIEDDDDGTLPFRIDRTNTITQVAA